MATNFVMPSIGDGIESAIVTRWLKKAGDTVKVDDPLVEVSTDKVDTELPSPATGTLKEILVSENDAVSIGATLAVIVDGDEAVTGLRRGDLRFAIAESMDVDDEDRFDSAGGGASFVLPRYVVHSEVVGAVTEPQVVIAQRDGVDVLVVTLDKVPGPAAGPTTQEIPHFIKIRLRMAIPFEAQHEMTVGSPLDVGTRLSAELPLQPGQREQFVAAVGDTQADVRIEVDRIFMVSIPNGQRFTNGEPAYEEHQLHASFSAPPAPLLLSERQRARLSGDAAAQNRKVLVDFEGRTHTYWQDANEPAQFAYLPDAFLLARSATVPLKSQLRAAVHTGGATPKFLLEFTAAPVTSARRLAAARTALAAKAQEFGAAGPVTLHPLDDARPVLRLALPVNGAPSPNLVERNATRLDMQTGLRHSEVFELDDFRAVFAALNGESLTLLGGEILVRGGTPDEAEVPLELRLDRAGGDVLQVHAPALAPPTITMTLTNGIESPVLLDGLRAAAIGANTQLPLALDQLPPDSRLGPGESCDVRLTLGAGAADPEFALLVDQVDVRVEPDEKAIWELIFDKHTEQKLVRDVQIHALAAMFKDPARPDDQVLEFIVTIENGSSAIIGPNTLDVAVTAPVPVIPLLTGDGSPKFRYRTETHWSSGGLGTSDWREVDSTIIVPVRVAP